MATYDASVTSATREGGLRDGNLCDHGERWGRGRAASIKDGGVTESSMGRELEAWKPSKVTRVAGRNLPFDALQQACGIDIRNKAQLGRLTKALKDIRAYFAEEVGSPSEVGVSPAQWEQGLATAILARARAYRQQFPRAALTPTALSAWWHQMAMSAAAEEFKQQRTQDILDRMKRKELGREGQ